MFKLLIGSAYILVFVAAIYMAICTFNVVLRKLANRSQKNREIK